jgi:type IX secretion system PorP/SprF family membrane protein
MKAIWQTGLGWLWLFLGAIGYVQAQDPVFSQFFANKLYLNPAYAGFDPGINVYSAYRSQWMGVDGNDASFLTSNVGLSVELPALMSGVGFQAIENVEGAGDLRWRSYELQYGFRNRPCFTSRPYDMEFSLGMGLSYNQWRLDDPNALIFSDQLNPFFGQVRNNSAVPLGFLQLPSADFVDFSAGGLIDFSWGARSGNSWKKSWVGQIGGAFRHLRNRANGAPTQDVRPTRYTLHGFLLNQGSFETSSMTTIIMGRMDMQPSLAAPNLDSAATGRYWFRSLQLGGMIILADEPGVWTGAWWHSRGFATRNIHSLAVGLGFRIPMDQRNSRSLPRSLHLGASYDFNLNGVLNDGGGTFELTLSLRFPNSLSQTANIGCGECLFSNRRYPVF